MDNVAYSYQWLADDTDMPGHHLPQPTHSPSDEEGNASRCKVSFTDDAGNERVADQPPARPVPALWPDRHRLGKRGGPELEPPG